MRLLPCLVAKSLWPLLLTLMACSGTPGPGEPTDGAGGEGHGGKGSGGATEVVDCSLTSAPSLEIGQGEDLEFTAFEDGDVLKLIFGSQAGMEAPFSVVGSRVALSDVERIETALMVDEYPVGEATDSGGSLRCVDGRARLDTAILIDVSLHPDIVSVVQLVERDADLVATFYDAEGAFVTQSVRVELER